MTREEKLAAVDAYFTPKLAARQTAYDQYVALEHARDAKVREINEWYDRKEAAELELARLGSEPSTP